MLWRWWTFVVVVLGALGVSQYYVNIAEYVWEKDHTYLGSAMVALFTVSTLAVGLLTWLHERGDDLESTPEIMKRLWFLSEAFMGLGMIGTLAGLLMIFGPVFADLDASDVSSIRGVIKTLGTGIGTAFMATLIGLVCSILLKYQLLVLEEFLDERV